VSLTPNVNLLNPWNGPRHLCDRSGSARSGRSRLRGPTAHPGAARNPGVRSCSGTAIDTDLFGGLAHTLNTHQFVMRSDASVGELCAELSSEEGYCLAILHPDPNRSALRALVVKRGVFWADHRQLRLRRRGKPLGAPRPEQPAFYQTLGVV